jgi:hypothetical protein
MSWFGGLGARIGLFAFGDTPSYIQGFSTYFSNNTAIGTEEWYLSLDSFFSGYDKLVTRNFEQDVEGFVTTFLQWLPNGTAHPLIILRIFLKLKQYGLFLSSTSSSFADLFLFSLFLAPVSFADTVVTNRSKKN